MLVNVPVKPTRPTNAAPDHSRRPGMTVVMVLIIGFLLSGFLLILPGFIGQAILIGGLFLFVMTGFHYIVWGRWLTRVLREEALEEIEADQ